MEHARNMTIVLDPIGGLCNRMRAIDSGMALARHLGRDLHVVWTMRRELNCRFDRLFESLPGVRMYQLPRLPTRVYFRLLRFGVHRLAFRDAFEQSRITALLKEKKPIDTLCRPGGIYIRTCSRFFGQKPLFTSFKPVRAIQDVVDARVAAFGPRTIGVHVRRGDNVRSIEQSPIERFIEVLGEEVARAPETTFFVATDAPDEEARLRRAFPDRVLTHPKRTLSRDDPRGIEDALVDLMCLASTQKVVGSYWSSFSTTAAAIRDIERTIITVNEPG
jgi:hypothetical protein